MLHLPNMSICPHNDMAKRLFAIAIFECVDRMGRKKYHARHNQ